ncbi:MAG: DUF3899 domain-containing protein [Lachnospiraceae bacterium]|nr:DUF3899 domain-containing protein [Lachnospiraceae bacterium]
MKDLKEKKKLPLWVPYLIAFAFSFAAVYLVYLFQKEYYTDSVQDLYKMLSNAFFFVGVMFTGFGALILISMAGNFIGLGYLFLNIKETYFGWVRGKMEYQRTDYKDYKLAKEAKEEEKRKEAGKWRILIVGIVNIIISMVFLKLFYTV